MCDTGAARTLRLLSEEGEGHKEKRLKTNETVKRNFTVKPSDKLFNQMVL